jgi:hypothetical protein
MLPLGAAADEDIGERSAVDVVAGGAVAGATDDP